MLPRLDDSIPIASQSWARSRGLDPLTWLAWALVPAVAFALLAPPGIATARDRGGRGDRALRWPSAACNSRRLDRFRGRAVGSPARISRLASSVSSTRASPAGAVSSRSRPSISAGRRRFGPRSARCSSAFSTRRKSVCRARRSAGDRPDAALRHRHRRPDRARASPTGAPRAEGPVMIDRAPSATAAADRVDPGRRHQFLFPRRDAEPLSGGGRRPAGRSAAAGRRREAPAVSSCTRLSGTIRASTITSGGSCRVIISSAIPTRRSSRASIRRDRARSSAPSAATAPFSPPISRSSCASRGSSASSSRASRPMSASAPPCRTPSPTASCRRRAERGDQLQSAASRGGVARGHRTLFRRGRVARTRARDASMSIVVTGYASLDYVGAARLAAAAGPDRRPSSRAPPTGRVSAARRPMSQRRSSPAASRRNASQLGRRRRRGRALPGEPRTSRRFAPNGGSACGPAGPRFAFSHMNQTARCHCLYDPGLSAEIRS